MADDPSFLNEKLVRESWYKKFVRVSRWWRRGVAVERRIRDREIAGSSLGRELWRKNSGQVSHTYG